MTPAVSPIDRIRELGGAVFLDGERLRYRIPAGDPEARQLIAEIHRDREAVIAMLRERQVALGSPAPPQCPPLPPGVRLVRYAPKTPPVAIQPCSIVTDVDKFIRAYLQDLGWRLANPKTYACAPLYEILAKLAEVGVELALD